MHDQNHYIWFRSDTETEIQNGESLRPESAEIIPLGSQGEDLL